MIGLVAAVGGYLTAELVNPDDIVPLTFLWLCLAMGGSLATGVSRFPVKRGELLFGTYLVVTILALLLVILSFYPFLAEVHLLRAEETPSSSLEVMLREFSLAQRYNPYYDRYPFRVSGRLIDLIERRPSQNPNLNLGIVTQAINSGEAAIRKSPLEADNYVILGKVYRTLGRVTGKKEYYYQGIDLYRQALKKNKYHIWAIYGLAKSYYYLGDKKNALKWINFYLNLTESEELSNLKRQLLR